MMMMMMISDVWGQVTWLLELKMADRPDFPETQNRANADRQQQNQTEWMSDKQTICFVFVQIDY